MAEPAAGRIRVDKWLWHARVVRSRTLAAELVGAGHLRVNGQKVTKPAHTIGPGDVLTVAVAGRVRVLRVLAPGLRRGPAAEAQQLYEDLSDPPAAGNNVAEPTGELE